MNGRRLAIFDCDGTIVDSQATICRAMENAFVAAGLEPPPRAAIRHTVGLSLAEIMRRLLPEGNEVDHRDMVERYRAAFFELRAAGQIDEALYEGIADLLDALRMDGWLLAIATGKSDRGLEISVEHHGLTGLFMSLQTADRHPSKPHPSMIHQALADAGVDAAQAVMIGDTVYDIHMGHAAGCATIGVGWGYHPLSELRDAGADHLAETMDELQQILGKLNGRG